MRIWTFLSLLVIFALLSGAAFAALVTIDENGNGTLNGNPIAHYVGLDNGPGGLSNALIYDVGATWDAGDLLIYEDQQLTVLSDVVRFKPNGQIVFYSEIGDADLADIGLPSDHYSLTIARPEQGVEGNNWCDYAPPQPGSPGYSPSGLTYHIISDAVPEPGSLLALGSGLLGLIGLRLRKR